MSGLVAQACKQSTLQDEHTLGYFWLYLEMSAGDRCNEVVPPEVRGHKIEAFCGLQRMQPDARCTMPEDRNIELEACGFEYLFL